MHMAKRLVPIGALVALIAGLVGINALHHPTEQQKYHTKYAAVATGSDKLPAPQVIHADASNAFDFKTFASLTKASDLVAYGQIVGTPKSYLVGSGPNALPFTDFQFRIDSSLKGVPEAQTIVLHQTGGPFHGAIFVVDDDPLMKPQDCYVLFLRRYAPEHYFILGGAQGRIVVTHGMVHSLGTMVPAARGEGPQVDGVSLHDFEMAIATYAQHS